MESTPPQAVKVFIYQGSRLLLQLRDNKPDIFFPNHWGLFGGLIDAGETPAEGLKREIEEELGWTPPEFKFLLRWDESDDPCVNHIFAAPLTVDLSQLKLTEGQALGLFALEELTQLLLVPKIPRLLPQVVEAIASEELTASWQSLTKLSASPTSKFPNL
jgi:8-oxo-dGTP diphosphatase